MFGSIKDKLSRLEQRQGTIEHYLQSLTGRLDNSERLLGDIRQMLSEKAYAGDSIARDSERQQMELIHHLQGLQEEIRQGLSTINDAQEQIALRMNESKAQTNSYSTEAESVLRSYSEQIRLYEQDLYNKIKSPLLMELIGIADRLSDAAAACENDEDKNLIQRERKAIIGILHNNSVEEIVSAIGTTFNAELQTVINAEETDNPEMDNTIARSIRPGYVWTLPFAGRSLRANTDSPARVQVIMREEQITLYILKNQ